MRGSLKRIAENHWRLVYDLPSSDGKRHQRVMSFRGNKRQAERELAKRVEDVHGGYRGSTDTLGAFLRGWIAARTCAANTRAGHENALKYIESRLGDLRLEDVTPLHLQRLYAELLSRGKRNGKSLKASSVAQVHNFLHAALSDALKMGLVAFNPCERVRKPKAVKATPKILTQEQAHDLLQQLRGSVWWFVCTLAAVTGCRLGELLALRRGDFKLRECVLIIERSVDRFGNIKAPKNNRPRVIPLPPEIVPVIEEHLPESGPLFEELAKNSMRASARFIKVCERLGYAGVHFHTFRHTVGSLLMARGVHPKAIQQLLGHHAVAYTMDVYSHLMPGAFDDTTKTLATLVRDQSVITGEVSTEKTR